MKWKLGMAIVALGLLCGCKKSQSASQVSPASDFTSVVNLAASKQDDTHEAASIDNVSVDQPETGEPASV